MFDMLLDRRLLVRGGLSIGKHHKQEIECAAVVVHDRAFTSVGVEREHCCPTPATSLPSQRHRRRERRDELDRGAA